MPEVITPQTTAETSGTLILGREGGLPLPATLYVIDALDGVEEITVEYWDGAEWRDSQQRLDVGHPMLSLYSPAIIRVDKPITVNEVGVGTYTSRYSTMLPPS